MYLVKILGEIIKTNPKIWDKELIFFFTLKFIFKTFKENIDNLKKKSKKLPLHFFYYISSFFKIMNTNEELKN